MTMEFIGLAGGEKPVYFLLDAIGVYARDHILIVTGTDALPEGMPGALHISASQDRDEVHG
jgi:hypothetical protein